MSMEIREVDRGDAIVSAAWEIIDKLFIGFLDLNWVQHALPPFAPLPMFRLDKKY